MVSRIHNPVISTNESYLFFGEQFDLARKFVYICNSGIRETMRWETQITYKKWFIDES